MPGSVLMLLRCVDREGYPNRMPFWVLLRRYRPLWQGLTGSKGKPDTGDGRKECQALLNKWLDPKHWQLVSGV